MTATSPLNVVLIVAMQAIMEGKIVQVEKGKSQKRIKRQG